LEGESTVYTADVTIGESSFELELDSGGAVLEVEAYDAADEAEDGDVDDGPDDD
jgi:hypothetical protein